MNLLFKKAKAKLSFLKKWGVKYLRVFFSQHDFLERVFEPCQNNTAHPDGPVAICIGFNLWKQKWLHEYLPGHRIYFVRGNVPSSLIVLTLKKLSSDFEVYIWGSKGTESVVEICQQKARRFVRVEDGFIRSIGLGADHTKPLSLAFDDHGIYYDATAPSRLEEILQTIKSRMGNKEAVLAQQLIELINDHYISKYNFPERADSNVAHQQSFLAELKLPDDCVLAIGQVEDDQSVLKGAPAGVSNLTLVEAAISENPGKKVVFRPHPDTWYKKRSDSTRIEEIRQIATIIPPEIPTREIWPFVSQVYTITSLLGMEALIRGLSVVCLGAPFYSGWGLTSDRCKVSRRNAELRLEELVYGAYFLYPDYLLGGPIETVKHLLVALGAARETPVSISSEQNITMHGQK